MLLRIIHIAIILMELWGLYLSFSEGKWKIFIYYTELSNSLALVSSVLFLILGQTAFVTALRYIACCMLTFTFFVCLCVLIPMGVSPHYLFLEGHCFFYHLACPLVSVLTYVFLEEHAGKEMIPAAVAVTFLYGLVMVVLNAVSVVDGPYPFFKVHDQSKAATVLWMAVLLLAAGILFSLLWLAAR